MCPKTTCASTSETNKLELSTQQCQTFSFKIVVVQLFLRVTNSSPHALHADSGKQTAERASVRVVNPYRKARLVKPTWSCIAMTAASLKHQSLRLLHEYHLLSHCTIFIMHLSDGKSMLGRMLVTMSSRGRPKMWRRWILSLGHGKSAESTQSMDPTLGTKLSVDNRTIFVFLSTFSVLNRSSVTVTDGSTLDTDC